MRKAENWHKKILNTFKYLCRVCGGNVTSEYLTEGFLPNHLCRSCASSVCTLLIKVANNSIFNTLYGAVLCLLQYLKGCIHPANFVSGYYSQSFYYWIGITNPPQPKGQMSPTPLWDPWGASNGGRQARAGASYVLFRKINQKKLTWADYRAGAYSWW